MEPRLKIPRRYPASAYCWTGCSRLAWPNKQIKHVYAKRTCLECQVPHRLGGEVSMESTSRLVQLVHKLIGFWMTYTTRPRSRSRKTSPIQSTPIILLWSGTQYCCTAQDSVLRKAQGRLTPRLEAKLKRDPGPVFTEPRKRGNMAEKLTVLFV